MYKKVFPNFPELDVQLPPELCDTSNKNDVAPSWQHEEFPIRIIVDHPLTSEREIQYNGQPIHIKRFVCYYHSGDHGSTLGAETDIVIDGESLDYWQCASDNWEEILAAYYQLLSLCYSQSIPRASDEEAADPHKFRDYDNS